MAPDIASLRTTLLERPDLIPPEAIRPGAAPLRLAIGDLVMAGPGGIEMLAFNPAGDIALVRCRTVQEGSAGSAVVLGQVLEDAAAIGGSAYWELDARVRERTGTGLADAMQERMALAGAEAAWDRTAFEQRAGEALESGDLTLVIALDRTDERLLRTIHFIWEAWAVVLPLRVVALARSEGEWHAEIVY